MVNICILVAEKAICSLMTHWGDLLCLHKELHQAGQQAVL